MHFAPFCSICFGGTFDVQAEQTVATWIALAQGFSLALPDYTFPLLLPAK